MSLKILTFEEALKNAGDRKKHLLIGNGFSVGLKPDIFSYKSMKEKSEHVSKELKSIFDGLKTVDFEEIIRALEYAHKICEIRGMKNEFKQLADELRHALIETIADHHPDRPNSISDAQFESCVRFLQPFERVFTLNYDMLLYWVLMRDKFTPGWTSKLDHLCDDGFAYGEEEFLNWTRSDSIKIYYLHGALHLFENIELEKLNYSQTSIPLKEQFTNLIFSKEKLPLFVTEGDSMKKLERINRSPYLAKAHASLEKIGRSSPLGALFILGASLSATDNHIVKALSMNKCQEFYVGIFGDPASSANRALIEKAKSIADLRRSLRSRSAQPSVFFFDSASAKVWG